jgi:hypothetical protein
MIRHLRPGTAQIVLSMLVPHKNWTNPLFSGASHLPLASFLPVRNIPEYGHLSGVVFPHVEDPADVAALERSALRVR